MASSRFSLEKLQTWIWIWIILTLSQLHYSCALCGSVCINCDLQHLVSALSAKLREEELGQQPWACCCHRFTAFEWFSPLPHVCVVFPLSVSFSVVLPLCSPSVLICHQLSIHSICFAVNLCSTLLCSFPVFPFKHGWMLPDICCAFFFNCDYDVSIWLYSQKCTLISGCI